MEAFPAWRDTPVSKRVQVLFNMKVLLDEHLEELTCLCARENGKKWDEAMGDVLKVIEVVEFACGAPHLMKGESLMNVSPGYDTVRYNEPLGVFAGIAPWNFPAMIPHGWMVPICVAAGNCMVLKAASFAPQCALRITELWTEAGLPPGVLGVVTTSRNEAEIFLTHPEIKGVTFVGSTSVGLHIYRTAAANGKRVQALTEAKNHALVLEDCVLERAAQSIINSFCGCAGERCMALPVIVVAALHRRPTRAPTRPGRFRLEARLGLRQVNGPGASGQSGTQGVRRSAGSRKPLRKARNWCWTAGIRRCPKPTERASSSDRRSSIMSPRRWPAAARRYLGRCSASSA